MNANLCVQQDKFKKFDVLRVIYKEQRLKLCNVQSFLGRDLIKYVNGIFFNFKKFRNFHKTKPDLKLKYTFNLRVIKPLNKCLNINKIIIFEDFLNVASIKNISDILQLFIWLLI